MLRRWLLIVAVPVVLFFAWRLWKWEKPPVVSRNVLLITIDTLRADHLGAYGYAPARTMHMDDWARSGAMFLNVTATTPLTLPSHSSIMTGTYPLSHQVRDNGGYYLEDKWLTLAEHLKQWGFRTGGFISAFVLDRRWGIAQGFEEYFDHFELSKFKIVSLDSVQRRGEETLEKALPWIASQGNQRFFAWIHFYDPHLPYDPPEPFRAEFSGRPYGLYDAEISYVDTLIGRIEEFLEKNHLNNTTSVILTSDHGEGLGDHQEAAHGFFIYDSTIQVPLIILHPGLRPIQISDQVRSIDLYPTICELVGVPIPDTVEGVSLLPLLLGKQLPQKLTAYSESYYPRFHYGWSELKSIRTTEYKFISAPAPEFYRLPVDPQEKNNLYSAGEKKVSPFQTELNRLIQKAGSSIRAPQAMDDESMEKLHALGYIGSFSGAARHADNLALPDPKEKILLYNKIKIAQGKSSEGETEEAMRWIQEVLQQDPAILEARLVEGNLLLKKEDPVAARISFQKVLEMDPNYMAAIFGLARTYEMEHNWEAARAGFLRLTGLDPRDPKGFFHLAEISLAEKKFEEAISYYQKVISLAPDQPIFHNQLGACYLEMKQYDLAKKEIEKALQLNPRVPFAHFNLALLHEETGNIDAAISEYTQELKMYPETYEAYFNLSRIYRHIGRRDLEREELGKCIAAKPDFGVAYLYLAKNYMDTGDNLQKAKELTEKGLSQKLNLENETLAHYLMADIYNRLGDSGQSFHHARKAQFLQKQIR